MFADNLAPALAKSQYDKAYRLMRKARKRELIKMHHEVLNPKPAQSETELDQDDYAIGFKARRLLRSGDVVNLPHEYAFILKACQEFI
ncbi:hypothetical protein AB4489_26200, partial [Vibrio sp. 10N.222.55.F8]